MEYYSDNLKWIKEDGYISQIRILDRDNKTWYDFDIEDILFIGDGI